MAEMKGRNSNRRQSSRLQRRAPASIQITPVSDWKVAIPLLSPLATSPSSPPRNLTSEIKSKEISQSQQSFSAAAAAAADQKPVFKKWQHPAAPFCYESAPLMPPFVPV
ncbi:hypothetical protein RJ641_003905 [Dillenia turbinata]|uniref:Uncharacterized protein n=1 Tax=Dillenia turbinata TaxID=194707 RepID=A0AAN8VH39_9MAGN